jgi:glucan-binding YG repeat protein
MAAQDNLSKKQFPAMYHGTRAHITGGVILPSITEGESRMARAWATSDPGQARFFGETKMPKGAENNPVKVYKVTPVSNQLKEEWGNIEGEKFYSSPHGFMITGEHK